MSTKLGDIFWDLAPWMQYAPSKDIGCIIYVANPTTELREYALMSSTYTNGTMLSEGNLQVYGYAWFPVEPGKFIRLHGSIKSDQTDVRLVVDLIERTDEEKVDSVSTLLVSPTRTGTGALPPPWSEDDDVEQPIKQVATNSLYMLMMLMMIMVITDLASTVSDMEKERINDKSEVKKLPSPK